MQQQRGQFVYINGAVQQPMAQNVVVMPQGQQQRQQFVVLAPAQQQFVTSNHAFANYPKRGSIIMGIMQIIMAIFLMGLNIGQAAIGYNAFWVISSGWWSMPFIILAGSFGIAAGCRPSSCTVISSLVFSIFSLLAIMGVLVQGGLSLGYGCDNYWSYYPCYYNYNTDAHIAVSVFFLLTGLAEFAFALTQSIYCCKTYGQPSTQVNQISPQGFNNGGFVPCYVHPQGIAAPQMVSMPTAQNVAMPTAQAVAMPTAQAVAMPTGQYAGTTAQTNVAQPPEYTKEQLA